MMSLSQPPNKTTAPSLLRFSPRDMALVGVSVAMMAAFSQITIPLAPVPFSFGILGALLIAVILPTRLAVTTQVVYLLLGAVGAPVFAQFQGGFQRLVGPTGGYLLGYILLALVVGILLSLCKKERFWTTALITLAGLLVCYLGGTVWLAVSTGMGLSAAIAAGVLPFLPLDCLKVLLAAAVGPRLRDALMRGQSR